MQEGAKVHFTSLTQVNYQECDVFNETEIRFKEDCIKSEQRKAESHDSDFYRTYSNAKALTKPFLFVTKNDSKELTHLWINYVLETIDKNHDKYERLKKDMTDIIPAMNKSIDHIWFYMYLFLNPLIPLAVATLQHFLGNFLKNRIKKLK